jgi:anti-anti-sigma regulatory factor
MRVSQVRGSIQAGSFPAGSPTVVPGALHAQDWGVKVERGPDWLFLRLQEDGEAAGGDGGPLSERLWGMIRANRAHRVVLELDRVDAIDDSLIGAIADVSTRMRDDGGFVRVCGLSESNLERLRSSGQADGLTHFESRTAAVGPRCGAAP